LTGVPILIRGMGYGDIPPQKVIRLERFLQWKTDMTICNSYAGKQVWKQITGCPEEKITVVPNGFNFGKMQQTPYDFHRLRKLLELADDEPVVGCIGSIYDLKNPLMFVEVAATLVGSGTSAHFAWIGDGPMRLDMEYAICERGLKGRVHLL